eukprot:scaffold1001_cov188-Ochromonas_danica.AAC.12
MKILRKVIDRKTGGGDVSLEAEEDDDMFHLYQLIVQGDIIEAVTIRNVRLLLLPPPPPPPPTSSSSYYCYYLLLPEL